MEESDLQKYKGKIIKHFKGDLYLLIGVSKHTENGEVLVIYKELYGECELHARPISSFLSKVDTIKYPDCFQIYRFAPVTMKSMRKREEDDAINEQNK